MSAADTTTATVLIRTGRDGTPFFEAKWRDEDGRQVKRRLGPAWLVRDRDGEGWHRRRGRVPEGWLDERTAHVAAAAKVEAVAAGRAAAAEAARRLNAVTFRQVAHEWLAWKRDVRRGAPSTLYDAEVRLREPGAPHRRGDGVSRGWIMERFGHRPYDEVTTREVAAFLRELDAAGMSARNVNAHRSVLHGIFAYAMKPDTYELPSNPVAGTDQRAEPPPPPLDHYEVEEIEALARVCERGGHRDAPPNYQGRPSAIGDDERAARAAEDAQDADLFRVTFYSGMRIGEIVALRWHAVHFEPDLSGAVIQVQRTVSAGQEREPKGRVARQVPVPRPAAEALARLYQRREFTEPEDYVFCNRFGRRLDVSAIRRRYKRAAAGAGLRPMKLHGLRHAAGSVLARTVPLVTVRDILGHTELKTTNRYLHSKIDKAAILAVNAAFGVPIDGASAAEAAPGAPTLRDRSGR